MGHAWVTQITRGARHLVDVGAEVRLRSRRCASALDGTEQSGSGFAEHEIRERERDTRERVHEGTTSKSETETASEKERENETDSDISRQTEEKGDVTSAASERSPASMRAFTIRVNCAVLCVSTARHRSHVAIAC
eukprot:278018-Rhodomonas_salina.2